MSFLFLKVCFTLIRCIHVYLCTGMHRYLWGPEKGLDALELELQALMSCLTWVLGPDLGPLGKQHMLFTTEPTLQPKFLLFYSLRILLHWLTTKFKAYLDSSSPLWPLGPLLASHSSPNQSMLQWALFDFSLHEHCNTCVRCVLPWLGPANSPVCSIYLCSCSMGASSGWMAFYLGYICFWALPWKDCERHWCVSVALHLQPPCIKMLNRYFIELDRPFRWGLKGILHWEPLSQ